MDIQETKETVKEIKDSITLDISKEWKLPLLGIEAFVTPYFSLISLIF